MQLILVNKIYGFKSVYTQSVKCSLSVLSVKPLCFVYFLIDLTFARLIWRASSYFFFHKSLPLALYFAIVKVKIKIIISVALLTYGVKKTRRCADLSKSVQIQAHTHHTHTHTHNENSSVGIVWHWVKYT